MNFQLYNCEMTVIAFTHKIKVNKRYQTQNLKNDTF